MTAQTPEAPEDARWCTAVILMRGHDTQGLPEMLLPYLRLAHCTDSESLKAASLDSCCSAPISAENELTVLNQLASHLQYCLSRCVPGASASLYSQAELMSSNSGALPLFGPWPLQT